MNAAAPSEDQLTIERAYRMRVYPTRSQARQLAQLVGATRRVWNWALDRRTAASETLQSAQASRAKISLRSASPNWPIHRSPVPTVSSASSRLR